MKKIYIEGMTLVEGHFSGIGQYILGVLRGIDQIIDYGLYSGEKIPKVTVIIPKDQINRYRQFGLKHIDYRTFPLPFRYMAALWHRGWLPPMDLFCGKGVYVFPRFVGASLLFSSSVVVIYDLSYELYEDFSDYKNARFLSRFVPKTIKSSKKVFTISNSVSGEVIKRYDLPSRKVAVATPATNPALFYRRSEEEIAKVKQKYGISGEYILALSNLEPRKNLETLVRAYCQLPVEKRKNLSLLLVGVNGWKTQNLFLEILDKVQQGYNITRPSEYVTDLDKPAVLSGAKMLVYPSHYEGFGMPPLEALACGVPVICSDNSSLPEVVGTAARLVNSHDQAGLTKAILDYLEDYDNVAAKALIEGPKQARKFSWEESARKLFDIIKDIS